MPDCVFCKTVKGEIPCYKIYEDSDFLAFLDIKPVNPGHTQVITKKHFETILDVPPNVLSEMIKVVQKISKTITETVNAHGFNININTREAAGQAIFHIHIHIIPRFKNDGYKLWPGKKVPKQELEKLAEKIRNSL